MPLLFQLQFTGFSVLWLLFSLALGLTYAFLLYSGKSGLSPGSRRILFGFRGISVALITFLLFAPFVKHINRTVEKPLVLILQDNSASIQVSRPSGFDPQAYNRQMKKLENTLAGRYQVETFRFGAGVRAGLEASYTDKGTDIDAAFKFINDRYANRNVGAVILASDGIYNQGGNPQYQALNLKSPVYTIALGDTIPKKDLLIANVSYNDIAYLGDDFQISVQVEAYQSKGTSSSLNVTGKSGTLFSRRVSVTSNEYRLTVPVTLSARQKGIQRFTVNIAPVAGELSRQNNSRTFFVEVLDGKKKVVLLANSPHPDIAAFKESIEQNRNYEVKTGFANLFNKHDAETADLLILHEIPSAILNNEVLKPLLQRKNVWYVLGAQSNVSYFSSLQNVLSVAGSGAFQEATARLNPQFYDFVLTDATKKKLENFDPLVTPFGNYSIKAPVSVLLDQQIGRVSTNKPLFLFAKEADRRLAILSGEGIWRWRLEDFKENNNHQAVDELIGKTVQYLVSTDDKRRFRVYPARNSFDENEHVVFNAELYNESLELVNMPDVAINLKSAFNKSYPFQFSRTGSSYILDAGVLPPGEYSFLAAATLGKEKMSAKGQFVISEQQTELRQTTADHQLLQTIARQSGAELIQPSQIGDLPAKLEKNELVKAISYEDRRFEELISNKFLFFVILTFLAAEWFWRKRGGEL